MIITKSNIKIQRCCFAGHSQCYNASLKERLSEIIEKLICDNQTIEFWVGNYGQFDKLAALVTHELKKKHHSITLHLVIPYLTQEINEYRDDYYKNYDSIIMADIPESTPQKLKIIKSNQYMVDNSDFIICYVNRSWSGAMKTLEYAKKKKLPIYNLGSLMI